MHRLFLIGLALVLAGCGKSTEDWLAQLKDGDVVKRRQAIRELGARNADASQIVPALTEALRDESGYVRHDAATTLGKFGDAICPRSPANLLRCCRALPGVRPPRPCREPEPVAALQARPQHRGLPGRRQAIRS